MRLIIVERLVKAAILLVLATGFIIAGRLGLLTELAQWAQDQLVLAADQRPLVRVVAAVLGYLGRFPHQTALGLAVLLYASIEGTEGLGLALRRRWAEYLTVLATGFLIPYEALEVAHRLTATAGRRPRPQRRRGRLPGLAEAAFRRRLACPIPE